MEEQCGLEQHPWMDLGLRVYLCDLGCVTWLCFLTCNICKGEALITKGKGLVVRIQWKMGPQTVSIVTRPG